MTERQSTAPPFYSKNSMCGKQLYSSLIPLLHLIISRTRGDRTTDHNSSESASAVRLWYRRQAKAYRTFAAVKHDCWNLNELTVQANL
jgi:hypothetical protein